MLLFQDGSTTIEMTTPPKFELKKIPWRQGLLRDIAWCPALDQFLLLTQKALFGLRVPSSSGGTAHEGDVELAALSYSPVVPYASDKSFWRCTCDGKTVYIVYSGKRD